MKKKQVAVLGAANIRGERAEALEASASPQVRLRDAPVLGDCRLQHLLRRAHRFQRRHEDRQHAQRALHCLRRPHRSHEKSQRIQGMNIGHRTFEFENLQV